VTFYDPVTMRVKGTIREQELVGSLAYSPAGDLLALGDQNGAVRLWNTATLRVHASLKGHTDAVVSLGFFPDGRTLASASGDGTIKLWSVATAQELITLKGGNHLAIAADGLTLATSSDDGTVRLRRATTHREAVAFRTELDPDDPESPAAQDNSGDQLQVTGQFPEAEKAYRQARARLEKLALEFPNVPEYRQELAYNLFVTALFPSSAQPALTAEDSHRRVREICQSLSPDQRHILGIRYNRLSWHFLTDADPARHDSDCAVKLAQEAVAWAPEDGSFWTTLGVADYRDHGSKAAVAALETSMKLRQGGDSIDWFFLAMAHWQLGDKEEARRWYDRAAEWMDKNRAENADLRRFRAEAEELLKIAATQPAPTVAN